MARPAGIAGTQALLGGLAVPAALSLGHNYINHRASCRRGGHRQLQKMGFGGSNEQLIYINTPGKAGGKKFYSLERKLLLGRREKNFLHENRNMCIMFNIFPHFLFHRKYSFHNLNKYLNIQCLFNWNFEWILLFYYQHLGSTSMLCILEYTWLYLLHIYKKQKARYKFHISICFIFEVEEIYPVLTFLVSSHLALPDLQAHTCFIRQSFKPELP